MNLVGVLIKADYKGQVTSVVEKFYVYKETPKLLFLLREDGQGESIGFRKQIRKEDLGSLSMTKHVSMFTMSSYDLVDDGVEFDQLIKKVQKSTMDEIIKQSTLSDKWKKNFQEMLDREWCN